jgi:ankyrin repeat protein
VQKHRGTYTVKNLDLIIATQLGNTDTVSELLDQGADIEVKNDCGETALMTAITSNNQDVVRILLEKGANVNAKNFMGDTPLIVAALIGNEEIIKALLDSGAEVNAKDKDGWTALTWATENSHTKTAELLEQFGAIEKQCERVFNDKL